MVDVEVFGGSGDVRDPEVETEDYDEEWDVEEGRGRCTREYDLEEGNDGVHSMFGNL